MGLCAKSTLDKAKNGFDLCFWNDGQPACKLYEVVYTWRGHNVKLSLKPALNKHVAGKQRKRKLLSPIIPAMSGGVKWKEYLESLSRENLGSNFLVLVTSVECMPRRARF